MRELILNNVTAAVGVIAATMALILLKKGMAYMDLLLERGKAKAEAERKQYLSELFDTAKKVLETVTTTTVSKIEVTKAAALRKAVHAGQAAAEELNILSDEAYKEIVAQLPPTIEGALEEMINNLEAYIRDQIEEVLPEVKQKYKALTKETGNEAGA